MIQECCQWSCKIGILIIYNTADWGLQTVILDSTFSTQNIMDMIEMTFRKNHC